MSRMAELYQEQQEQENLSGADLAEAWYDYTRRLLNEHELIGRKIQYERNERKQLQNLKEKQNG